MVKTLVALFLGMLLLSCQKSDKPIPQPEAKKYDVTFTTGFASTVTNFSVGRKTTNGVNQPVAGNIDNLYYRIFNSSGAIVNSIDQASTATGFGVIADKLPAGNYTVFFAGSKGSLQMAAYQTPTLNVAYFYPTTLFWNDTFFTQFQLTIGSAPVTQSVSMDRLVGALDVTITDAIPANVNNIRVTFSDYMKWATFAGASSSVTSIYSDFTLSSNDVGIKNKVLSVFAGASSTNTPIQTDVTIQAYDSSNNVIAEKLVSNVPIYRNKRTALTGSLFSTGITNQNTGFTVTVNTDWGTAPTPITF